jgi:hypothetical protein
VTVRCVGAVLYTPTAAVMAFEHFPRDADARTRRLAIDACRAQLYAENPDLEDPANHTTVASFNMLHEDDLEVHWPNRLVPSGVVKVRVM